MWIKTFHLAVFLALASFTYAENEAYFLAHPDKIQPSLAKCTQNSSKDAQCQMLSQLAQSTMLLLAELEQDPQKFGLDILHLQTALVSKKKDPQALQRMEKELQTRLALIKLLNGPEASA